MNLSIFYWTTLWKTARLNNASLSNARHNRLLAYVFTAISVLAHFILISKIKILFHVKYFTLPITRDSAAEIRTVSANR